MDQQPLTFTNSVAVAPLAPMLEMGAYESLWQRHGMSFTRIANLLRERH
jgi:hypothetical protein